MEIRGRVPGVPGRRYVPKKRSISETNIKKMSPDMLRDRAELESEFVELEGGFTMYPSEILGFSDGSDNTML